MKTRRNLSPADYFEVLQREYLIAEFRSKIYYSPKDKSYYRKLMSYKLGRIRDIATRNNLKSIIDDNNIRQKLHSEIFENGMIKDGMSREDLIMYYKDGNKFSYNGDIYTLIDGKLDTDFLILSNNEDGKMINVRKSDVLRIL